VVAGKNCEMATALASPGRVDAIKQNSAKPLGKLELKTAGMPVQLINSGRRGSVLKTRSNRKNGNLGGPVVGTGDSHDLGEQCAGPG